MNLVSVIPLYRESEGWCILGRWQRVWGYGYKRKVGKWRKTKREKLRQRTTHSRTESENCEFPGDGIETVIMYDTGKDKD